MPVKHLENGDSMQPIAVPICSAGFSWLFLENGLQDAVSAGMPGLMAVWACHGGAEELHGNTGVPFFHCVPSMGA
jgi:hypothetical protein